MLAQKPNHFNSILGSRAFWANIFHSRSGPSEWDPCPIHLRHLDTYTMSSHAYIWSQWNNSMDVTFGMNHVKYHLFTLMGFDAHHSGILLAWVITKSTNYGWFGGVTQSFEGKDLGDHALLETKLFHYWWCPSELKALWWIRILRDYLFILIYVYWTMHLIKLFPRFFIPMKVTMYLLM